jgi:sigma-E factor negative regulatory protein RseB
MRCFFAVLILSLSFMIGGVVAPNALAQESNSNQDLNPNSSLNSPPTSSLTPEQAQAAALQQQSQPALKEANIDSVLLQVRKSLNTLNYEAAFIQVRGKFAEPFEWAHGIVEGSEVEYLRSQSGPNLEVVRKGNVVGYYEAETPPYAVYSKTISSLLPALFFDDSIDLGEHYSLAVGGKSRIIDRPAQLVRLVAKDNYRFNYWLWLDIQSGLILKSALVSKQGEVLEQFQMTQLNLLPQAPVIAQKVYDSILPVPSVADSAQVKDTAGKTVSKWAINWLPEGFSEISRNQHKLSLTSEVADYILVSDGLVEISIFIQPPLASNIKVGNLRSGSNIVVVHHGKGFDVSVIGKVPVQTAERIAQSVVATKGRG